MKKTYQPISVPISGPQISVNGLVSLAFATAQTIYALAQTMRVNKTRSITLSTRIQKIGNRIDQLSKTTSKKFLEQDVEALKSHIIKCQQFIETLPGNNKNYFASLFHKFIYAGDHAAEFDELTKVLEGLANNLDQSVIDATLFNVEQDIMDNAADHEQLLSALVEINNKVDQFAQFDEEIIKYRNQFNKLLVAVKEERETIKKIDKGVQQINQHFQTFNVGFQKNAQEVNAGMQQINNNLQNYNAAIYQNGQKLDAGMQQINNNLQNHYAAIYQNGQKLDAGMQQINNNLQNHYAAIYQNEQKLDAGMQQINNNLQNNNAVIYKNVQRLEAGVQQINNQLYNNNGVMYHNAQAVNNGMQNVIYQVQNVNAANYYNAQQINANIKQVNNNLQNVNAAIHNNVEKINVGFHNLNDQLHQKQVVSQKELDDLKQKVDLVLKNTSLHSNDNPDDLLIMAKYHLEHKEYNEAFTLLQRAGNAGSAAALFKVGQFYLNPEKYGNIVELNKVTAFEYFKKCSEKNYARAQLTMSGMMINGYGGFPPNLAEAKRLETLAFSNANDEFLDELKRKNYKKLN